MRNRTCYRTWIRRYTEYEVYVYVLTTQDDGCHDETLVPKSWQDIFSTIKTVSLFGEQYQQSTFSDFGMRGIVSSSKTHFTNLNISKFSTHINACICSDVSRLNRTRFQSPVEIHFSVIMKAKRCKRFNCLPAGKEATWPTVVRWKGSV
jgi:hypothetical protein